MPTGGVPLTHAALLDLRLQLYPYAPLLCAGAAPVRLSRPPGGRCIGKHALLQSRRRHEDIRRIREDAPTLLRREGRGQARRCQHVLQRLEEGQRVGLEQRCVTHTFAAKGLERPCSHRWRQLVAGRERDPVAGH